jgi:hypothetical protein
MASGDAPTIILRALHGELSDREMAMIGLRDDTKRAITGLIELSPALEEAILNVADLCYRDGLDAVSLGYGECTGMPPAPGSPPLEREPETCPVCHKEHEPSQIVKVGETSLIPGHEYIIVTKTSLQTYPREWRMGYLGYTAGLQFSARGPDRTHRGLYGGTQTIDLSQVISATEVERDDVKRHIGIRATN